MGRNFWVAQKTGDLHIIRELERRGHQVGIITSSTTIPEQWQLEEMGRCDGFIFDSGLTGLSGLTLYHTQRWTQPVALISWGDAGMDKEVRAKEIGEFLGSEKPPEHIKFFDLWNLDGAPYAKAIESICDHLGAEKLPLQQATSS